MAQFNQAWRVWGIMALCLGGMGAVFAAEPAVQQPATERANLPSEAAPKKSEDNPSSMAPIQMIEEVKADPKEDDILITRRPLITGLWQMPIPGKQCTELYNFTDDGRVIIRSAAERSGGQYELRLPQQGESRLPALLLRLSYDNLKADCAGNAIDQAGEITQYFVKWQDRSHIQFCSSAEGDECELQLTKMLP